MHLYHRFSVVFWIFYFKNYCLENGITREDYKRIGGPGKTFLHFFFYISLTLRNVSFKSLVIIRCSVYIYKITNLSANICTHLIIIGVQTWKYPAKRVRFIRIRIYYELIDLFFFFFFLDVKRRTSRFHTILHIINSALYSITVFGLFLFFFPSRRPANRGTQYSIDFLSAENSPNRRAGPAVNRSACAILIRRIRGVRRSAVRTAIRGQTWC